MILSQLDSTKGADAVQLPYLILTIALFAVALIFSRLNLPVVENTTAAEKISIKALLPHTHLLLGAVGIFMYVGAEGMKPLILRDVADEVELHESTVSRVTTNKYMLTPRGLFELKYFFSSHVGTSSGGEASSTAIRAKIKKLIADENPRKPLSDNTIANLLKEEGIDVARRTIAKYRESLNIPSSSNIVTGKQIGRAHV